MSLSVLFLVTRAPHPCSGKSLFAVWQISGRNATTHGDTTASGKREFSEALGWACSPSSLGLQRARVHQGQVSVPSLCSDQDFQMGESGNGPKYSETLNHNHEKRGAA